MISTTGSDSVLNFNGVPNGVFYTATQNCLVFFYSLTELPSSSFVRHNTGSYTASFLAAGAIQTGVKMNIGDTLTASGVGFPFKLIIIRYD